MYKRTINKHQTSDSQSLPFGNVFDFQLNDVPVYCMAHTHTHNMIRHNLMIRINVLLLRTLSYEK